MTEARFNAIASSLFIGQTQTPEVRRSHSWTTSVELERQTTFSTPVMTLMTSTSILMMRIHDGKLIDHLSCHSLRQCDTSRLMITATRSTCDNQTILMLPVDASLLSDHWFVVADCNCLPVPGVFARRQSSRPRRDRDVQKPSRDRHVSDRNYIPSTQY